MPTTKANREHFGQRIRYYRELRGWESEYLAQQVGKSASTISRIETGKQNVAVGDIKAIAIALGVGPCDLLDEEHDLPREGAAILARSQVERCAQKLQEFMEEFAKLRNVS